MKTTCLTRAALRGAVGLLAMFGSVSAVPVAIDDFSFEVLNQASGEWSNDLTGNDWIGGDGENDTDAFMENIAGFSADGDEHLGMKSGYYVFQDPGIPFEPNTRYLLTVGVGNRNDDFTQAGNESWIGLTNVLPPSDGSVTMAGIESALLVGRFVDAESLTPDGSFADVGVELVTGATPPAGNIVIVLGAQGVNRSHFDKVRLDAADALLDTDNDGLPDYWEDENGLDKNDPNGVNGATGDPDGDLVGNLTEFMNRSDPQNTDTDGDGVDDGTEIADGTDPAHPDSDLDGLPDGAEKAEGTNPNIPDSDLDGLTDGEEVNVQLTDPLDSDTDDDSLGDGEEVFTYGTDPLSNDTDGDTLLDAEEIDTHFTNPNDADTDRDGLDDDVELAGPTDPLLGDTDKDGLEDGHEVNVLGSNPVDANSPGANTIRSIGVNFVSDQASNATLAADEAAGMFAYRQKNWNNTFPLLAMRQSGSEADIDTPTFGFLTDSTGVSLDTSGNGTGFATTSVFWDSGTRFSANNGTASGNSKLMNGYLDGGSTVSFSGIPYARYDVVVYVGSDGNDRDGLVILTEDAAFTELARFGYRSNAARGGFGVEDYELSTDSGAVAPYQQANVVIFEGVSEPAITVENQLVVRNTGIFAIQLVERPVPGVVIALTEVTLTAPTQLQVSWAGGDGTNTVQTSTNGQIWSDAASEVSSPATIVVDPVNDELLLVRVIEP